MIQPHSSFSGKMNAHIMTTTRCTSNTTDGKIGDNTLHTFGGGFREMMGLHGIQNWNAVLSFHMSRVCVFRGEVPDPSPDLPVAIE